MAVRYFCGFDFNHVTPGAFGGANLTDSDGSWLRLPKPRAMFHAAGVATLDQTVAPPAWPGGTERSFSVRDNNSARGMSYGCRGQSGNAPTAYTGATSPTRAAWVTAQGHQLGFVKSMIGASGLTNNEMWFSFEIIMPNLPASSVTASTPSVDCGAIFRWGDVKICCKETVYVSGTSTTAIHNLVFAVLNNNVEVATVTVPSILCGSSYYTNGWMHCLLKVKLDATTGEIDFRVNGITQSASYTGQNTVAVISSSAANVIYFSPPVLDNGSTTYVGHLDHILFDDAEWPSGRPAVRLMTLLAETSNTDVSPRGTAPVSNINALTTYSASAGHARFLTDSARIDFTMTKPSAVGFSTTLLGIIMHHGYSASRTARTQPRLVSGVVLSGVDAEAIDGRSITLPYSTGEPNLAFATGRTWQDMVFEKGGGGKFDTTDLTNMTGYIRVATAA